MKKIVDLSVVRPNLNASTILLLEQLLADARAGVLKEIAIAGIFDGRIGHAYSTSENITQMLGAVVMLQHSLLNDILKESPNGDAA